MPQYKFHAVLDYNQAADENGKIPVLGYVPDKEVAAAIANHPLYYKDFGVNRVKPTPTHDIAEREVIHFSSLEEYISWATATKYPEGGLARQALSKLTEEEAAALGHDK